MKQVLKATQITVNINDYFDAEKKLYEPYPVFPFLTESEIKAGINELVDGKILREEVDALHELSKATKSTIANTNFIICLLKWNDYPELMKMLTIIREWAFRNDGGGVGRNDYDEFDLRPEMAQLMILNPDFEESVDAIIGGYRYIIHNSATYEHGPMGAHYQYSEDWKSKQWVELGRSFINPYFQQRTKRHSIDYVIHGLGYIFANYPNSEGFFGKVTLYNIFEQTHADKFFLATTKHYFTPTKDIWMNPDEKVEEGVLTESQIELLDKGVFKGLFYLLRNDYQQNIPKIMAVYNRMTKIENIMYFGAFRHKSFGNTTEVGIAIKSSDLYEVIMEKFVKPYAL
jgi:hypothetical protein